MIVIDDGKEYRDHFVFLILRLFGFSHIVELN